MFLKKIGYKNLWLMDIAGLSLFLLPLFFYSLGVRPLAIPDEGSYAEIIREMVQRADYITPYLNDVKFFEKPILLYWLGVFATKLWGLSFISLRSVNAILAMITCLFTYHTLQVLHNRETGLLASVILATSLLFFSLAHMLTTDMTVTTFITLSLESFILSIHQKNHLNIFYWLFSAVAAALAVLAKGLIGIVFPGIIIFLWLMITCRWSILKMRDIFLGLLVFLIIVLPWHIWVSIKNPEFFQIYFIQHHLLRFSTPLIGHPQPGWFYLPVFLIGFFPWIVFAIPAIANSIKNSIRKKDALDIYFLIWGMSVIIFFLIASSKLIAYVLPAFPPLAILTARYLITQIAEHGRGIKKAYLFLLIFTILLSGGLLLLTIYGKFFNILPAEKLMRTLVFVLIIGIFINYLFAQKLFYKSALIGTVITASVFLMLLNKGASFLDARSIYPLAIQLKTILKKEDKVIAFNHYYQDLAFYLERQVTILNSRKLFKAGMKYQSHTPWMIDDAQLENIWPGPKKIYAIMKKKEYLTLNRHYAQLQFYLLKEFRDDVLVTNHSQNG